MSSFLTLQCAQNVSLSFVLFRLILAAAFLMNVFTAFNILHNQRHTLCQRYHLFSGLYFITVETQTWWVLSQIILVFVG